MVKPKYREIFDRLNRDILSGHYRPGQKLPSEAALVKRFAVSRITVGRSLRELQQRGMIERVAGSGSFVKNAGPRPQSFLFGLVIPNLGETEIFEPICQAIAGSPDAGNHALLWPHSNPNSSNKDEETLQLCEQCIARSVAGVFFAPLEMTTHSARTNRRVMKLLRDAVIPVVLLDRRADDTVTHNRCDLVGIDNHRAGYLATQHLLRLGARRIGYVAYRGQAATVNSRIAGYRDALNAPGDVFQLIPKSPLEMPLDLMRCDAFVCANDRIAGHLMHALLATGIAVPGDVRIVGIDDVNYAALLPVPLTTVHQPCRDIGETALRVMLDRLNRPGMPARDVLLDCHVVVRQSCGGLAGSIMTSTSDPDLRE